MMKQIPYGITDFSRIQKENYYYVDKTMFIEKIEMQPPYLFLIRPRRFGKSLTLAMLEAYYDVNHAEQFDELFGQLYIGQHPTKLHNRSRAAPVPVVADFITLKKPRIKPSPCVAFL